MKILNHFLWKKKPISITSYRRQQNDSEDLLCHSGHLSKVDLFRSLLSSFVQMGTIK